jgi:Zn-finger nucleic acid-binding protein
MRCPADGSRLVEVERNDVLIDACPECRGVWLDRGELDRLLTRERQGLVGDPDEDFLREVSGGARDDDRRDSRRRDEPDLEELARLAKQGLKAYGKKGSHKKRKRKSVLEDLFDF